VTDTREHEAESVSILEELRVSRRGFLRLGIAGLVGLSLFLASGCGGSQDGGGEDGNGNGKKDKKDNGDDGGGGGGGY
jgi:hypothetical protein